MVSSDQILLEHFLSLIYLIMVANVVIFRRRSMYDVSSEEGEQFLLSFKFSFALLIFTHFLFTAEIGEGGGM